MKRLILFLLLFASPVWAADSPFSGNVAVNETIVRADPFITLPTDAKPEPIQLARMNPYVAGASAGGAAACGVQNTRTDGTDLDWYLGFTGQGTCSRGSFTVGAAGYKAKSISVYLKKAGSGTSTITVSICTDSADTSCQAFGTIAESSLTTSVAKYTVSYPTGYDLSATTQYWIKLSIDRGESGANVIYPQYNSAITGQAIGIASAGTCTYAAKDNSAQINHEVSTCE